MSAEDVDLGDGDGSRSNESLSRAEEELDESPLAVELRETLFTLGMGDINAAVRLRVLQHVGNDVARAVDWIMENGDQVALWMSAAEAGEEAPPSPLPVGAHVMTSDGKHARISVVRDDGTYDLEISGSPPRVAVSRDDFYPDPDIPSEIEDVQEQLDHVTNQLDQIHFGQAEEREEEDVVSEGETDLGRLLSHLREFSELAAMVSLQPGQAPSLRAAGLNAAAPTFGRGDRVVLATDIARLSEGQRGSLRPGEVGIVVEVGETHVNVRAESGERSWWYARSALAPAPGDEVAGHSAESLATYVEALGNPLNNISFTLRSVRHVIASVLSSGQDVVSQFEQSKLLPALAEGLRKSSPSVNGGVGAVSADTCTAYDALLQLVHDLGLYLFNGPDKKKEEFIMGDHVKVRQDGPQGAQAGFITDNLGFGRYSVRAANGREYYDADHSRINRKPIKNDSRSAGGIVGYLNELLVSRAVPLGDIGIVQRVLADGANIEHTDGDGNTPLMIAVERGSSLDLINVLLQNGAKVSAENTAGRTPLVIAAEAGKTAIVRRLLQEGADADKVDESKLSEEVMKILHEHSCAGNREQSAMDVSSLTATLKIRFVELVLPLVLQEMVNSLNSLSAETESRMLTVIVTVLENLPNDSKEILDKNTVVGPILSRAQDLLCSPLACEVLVGLRMVQAILCSGQFHAFELRRYSILQVLPTLNLKNSSPRKLHSEPIPNGAKPLRVHGGTAQGVSMLAESVLKTIESILDDLSKEQGNKENVFLAKKLAEGDQEALIDFRQLIIQPGRLTAFELLSSGLMDSLICFLRPSNPALIRGRAMQFLWIMLGQGDKATLEASAVVPKSEPGNDTRAILKLLRLLQSILTNFECMPVPQSGAAAERGLRQLLEPHRVKLEPACGVPSLDSDSQAQAKDKSSRIVTVLVEPLAPVAELSRHVMRTSRINDLWYQKYCRDLCGQVIYDRVWSRDAEDQECFRRALVETYRQVEPLGIGVHTVRYLEGDGKQGVRGQRRDVVLAVRDYKISTLASDLDDACFEAEDAKVEGTDTKSDDDEERVHMVMITYPHEAVPMDLFLDSVMGAVLQALRQPDPGQTPFGKQSGDEYDFPSRGFSDGQPDFQESLTRGLSEHPFHAPVARGQTRREANVLLARLSGICEASVKIERGRNYMPKPQQGSSLTTGCRVQSRHGREESMIGTILGQTEGGEIYSLIYDDGVLAEGVPSAVVSDLAKRRNQSATGAAGGVGRQLVFAFGRLHAQAPILDDDGGPANPAAIGRSFDSFLLKGKDAEPGRYEFSDCKVVRSASAKKETGNQTLKPGTYHEPPAINVAYALRPRTQHPRSVSTVWHPVSLSSQHRNLYALSNDGATARKEDRDTFVDCLRTAEPLLSGSHQYRLRIDEMSGEDFCNHVGFIAGDSYRGSALNSADSCCLEMDTARLSVDGRSSGTTISRRPGAGDILILDVDLDKNEFSAGIEGEGTATVHWGITKRPVFLAISFRRVGWKVSLVGPGVPEAGAEQAEESRHREITKKSLLVLDSGMTLFQAMHKVIDAHREAVEGVEGEDAAKDLRNALDPSRIAQDLTLFGQNIPQRGYPVELAFDFRIQAGNQDSIVDSSLEDLRYDVVSEMGAMVVSEMGARSFSKAAHSDNNNAMPHETPGSLQVFQYGTPEQYTVPYLHRDSARYLERLFHEVAGNVRGQLPPKIQEYAIHPQHSAAAEEISTRVPESQIGDYLKKTFQGVGFGPPACRAVCLLALLEYVVSVTSKEALPKLIPPEAWVSKQLSHKMSLLLEDPLLVASGCLPPWCSVIVSAFPSLFAFPEREQVVKCAAFGISHAMYCLQEHRVDPALRKKLRDAEQGMVNVSEMAGDQAQRAYDRLMHAQEAIDGQRIGRLRSDIARVQRGEKILEQAELLMEEHAKLTRKLEVQFVGEQGFGWGVTQGFYTAVALEMQRADDTIQLWRPTGLEHSGSLNGQYLQVGAEGLFPMPMHKVSQDLPKVCEKMRFLGRLMAKAFRDGFSVPVPLSPAFFAVLRGQKLAYADLPSLTSTGGIARGIAILLEHLERIEVQDLPADEAAQRRIAIRQLPCTILAPDYVGPAMTVEDYVTAAEGEWPAFVDPAGFVKDPVSEEPVELLAGGTYKRLAPEEPVLRQWVDAVVELWLQNGVRKQIDAFREGMEEVFAADAILCFSPVELQRMMCGHQEVVWTAFISNDWLLRGKASIEEETKALTENIAPIGRMSKDSPVFKLLIDELAQMENERRARFLDLVTANPRLPAGGLPQAGIKVAPRTGTRIWAQTCAKTLYLPDYTSLEDLRGGLEEAFANAALGGFHESAVPLGEGVATAAASQ